MAVANGAFHSGPVFTSKDISLIVRATNFAANKHVNQRRKDKRKTPYINLPIGTACILVEECEIFDPVTIASALLHDTVEDTHTTPEELKEYFGQEVSDIVVELTENKALPEAARKQVQLENMPNKSDTAKLIKLAHTLYNLRDIEQGAPVGWDQQRVGEYIEFSQKVVDGLKGTSATLDQALKEIIDHMSEMNFRIRTID